VQGLKILLIFENFGEIFARFSVVDFFSIDYRFLIENPT
jgi:hypothetical protein